jgi:hypothetical protein
VSRVHRIAADQCLFQSVGFHNEGPEAYAVVWENEGMNYNLGNCSFDGNSVETFGRLNFGIKCR